MTGLTPTFFVDRSLGRKQVLAGLRAAGWSLVTLAEYYGIPNDADVLDETWLALAGEKGWPVLMKDDRIRYRDAERRIVIGSAVTAFCLAGGTSGQLTWSGCWSTTRTRFSSCVWRRAPHFTSSLVAASTPGQWPDGRRRRTAEWAADRAVQRERLAIARDLHDIVSHGLGAVTVRAAVGRRLAAGDPAEALRALDDIEDAARHATAELRRMLGVLRAHAAPADPVVPLAPLPTLSRLPTLVEEVSAGGLRIALACDDTVSGLDEGVQLAAYRIVAEALTNVARYAGPTDVRVDVRLDSRVDSRVDARGVGPTLRVRVSDAGPGPGWRPHPGAGHGLLGVSERVAAAGGVLRAGPGPGGRGFVLEAELPCEAAS